MDGWMDGWVREFGGQLPGTQGNSSVLSQSPPAALLGSGLSCAARDLASAVIELMTRQL